MKYSEIIKKIDDLYNDVKILYDMMDTLKRMDQLDDMELIYYMNLERLNQKLMDYKRYMLKKIFRILDKEVD